MSSSCSCGLTSPKRPSANYRKPTSFRRDSFSRPATVGNLDGRVRYWHYGRDTESLNDGEIRLEFDVLDIEAVHRFEGRRSQMALAAGIRLAHLQLTDD